MRHHSAERGVQRARLEVEASSPLNAAAFLSDAKARLHEHNQVGVRRMSDQATRFWLEIFVIVAVMIASYPAERMIVEKRFSMRRMFHLVTAVAIAAAALAIRLKYWPA